MPSLFTAISCAILLAASTTATPARRATCTPNAQGSGVSIESLVSGLEWGVGSTPKSGQVIIGESFRGLAAPDFHVQQDGQVPTNFVIRDVDNNNLAVTTVGKSLVFQPTSTTGTEQAQLFDIVCQTCGTDTTPGNAAGSYCTISPVGLDGFCVRVGANGEEPLVAAVCNGLDDTLFNIVF